MTVPLGAAVLVDVMVVVMLLVLSPDVVVASVGPTIKPLEVEVVVMLEVLLPALMVVEELVVPSVDELEVAVELDVAVELEVAMELDVLVDELAW